MALSESALFELLVVLTDRERGVDLVRELARFLAQELIEVQAAQVIGAAGYERTDDRVTERNGHRPRTGDDVVMEAYVFGVSTRSVDGLVESMGGTGSSTRST
jgi:putative transposase